MLVSGGKILAIDKVYHDNTLSGDGVNKPLGVDPSQLGNNVDVKAGTSNVEVLTARAQESNAVTFTINVEGGGGGQSYDIVGENGVSAKKDIAESKWYIGLSAELPDIDALSALIASTYLSATTFDAYSADIVKQFTATSAWANETFQPKGEYLSASEKFLSANALDELSGKWESTYNTVSTASGGWNAHSALSAEVQKKLDKDEFNTWTATEFVPVKTDVDELKTHSAHYTVESKNNFISVYSGTNKFELEFVSGNLADKPWVTTEIERVLADFGGYVPCAGTGEDKHPDVENPDNKKMYLVPKEDSANPDRYYNWIVTGTDTTGWLCIGDTSMDLTPYLKIADISGVSGQWNTAYNYVIASSGDIASTSATVYEYSASWNAHSALSAAKLDANALDDVSAAWNAHSALSAAKQDKLTEAQLSAISSVSSLYNTEVVAGKNVSVESQTANNTVTYTISADDVIISGNNGISAEFDEDAKQWNVGLSATNSYACYVAPMTGDGTTYNVDEYEQVYNAGDEITLGNGTIDIAGQGLWHITVNATIENNAIDDNYYNTTLSFGTNTATIQFDNSYQHAETINLDFDKLISDDTTYSNAPIITDAPANALVHITNISIHKVATGITYMEGSTTYVGGKAIKIGDNNDINFVPGSGLQASYDGADVKLGDALGFDANSAIEVRPGSGLYIDDKQKLSLRLGKGLAFSGNGDVITIETDSDVNEVVETVQALQKELDGKLTTNMNISDAKSVGNPWAGDSNLNNLAASMFTIPLQHNLTTASTVSFITTQNLGQSDQAPLMIGILEYNFDYFVTANNELGVSSRSQTKWIADTGPIWADGADCYDIYGKNPAADGAGRYTYYLKNLTTVISSYVEDYDGKKYYNEVGPCLRSDRAYYLALFAHNPNNYKWFLSDDGFNTDTIHNTDPAISFRVVGCTYYNNETDPTGVSIDSTFLDNVRNGTQQFSMSGLPWWGTNRSYNAIDQIQRPYVMIRNPRM